MLLEPENQRLLPGREVRGIRAERGVGAETGAGAETGMGAETGAGGGVSAGSGTCADRKGQSPVSQLACHGHMQPSV